MLFRFKIQYLFVLLVFISSKAYGQEASTESEAVESSAESTIENVRLMEFTINRSSPLGGYDNALNRSLYGASLSYLNHPDVKRYYFFGFNISYNYIGSLTGTVFNNGDQFEDRTTSNHVSMQLVFRQFTPFYWSGIEPFIEGKFGPQLFYTSTSTTFFDETGSSDFTIDQTDFGFLYTIGVGATYSFYDSWHVLLKFEYNGATATSFLMPSEELTSEFPIDNFRNITTQTQFLSLNFGVSYSF